MSKFTTDRTYPRKWWSVSKWGDISSETFNGETALNLRYQRGRSTRCISKVTDWRTWHPTLEEAEAASAAIKAQKDARAADKRVHEAAPDLLAAPKEFSREYDGFQNGDGDPCPTLERSRTAIARAEGGAA